MDETFFERADVKSALDAIPEGKRQLFRALIVDAQGDQYQSHVPIGGPQVQDELQKAAAKLGRLSDDTPLSSENAPPAPVKKAEPTEAEKNAAIRSEIARLYGPNLRATQVLNYWGSVSRKLYGDTEPARVNTVPGKTPALGSVEALAAANRADPVAAAEPVPASAIVPRLPADNPLRKLMLANALQPTSSISRLVSEYLRADRAAKTATHANLRSVAAERRDILAQQIHAKGYQIPGTQR